ncbi:MAG: gamma-glutamyltransferase, partial [Gammaproteobacteria bacterium]
MISFTLRARAERCVRFAVAIVMLLWATFAVDFAAASGAVSSATPEATQAGIETLRRGGNAVDAAIAVAFALGVTEPAMSGLGGQVQMLVHPASGEPYVINGTSFAPGELPSHVEREDLDGRRATTVPSAVKVLAFAYRYGGGGRVAWADLIRPAIRFAEDGFV